MHEIRKFESSVDDRSSTFSPHVGKKRDRTYDFFKDGPSQLMNDNDVEFDLNLMWFGVDIGVYHGVRQYYTYTYTSTLRSMALSDSRRTSTLDKDG